jgi:hypothetical protein
MIIMAKAQYTQGGKIGLRSKRVTQGEPFIFGVPKVETLG